MNYNELMHFGILGMKWGKRKQPERYKGLSKSDLKERKKLDKKINKESRKTYRTNNPRIKNRMKVQRNVSKELSSSKNVANAWKKASESWRTGNMTQYQKDISKYNVTVSKISDKYDSKYVDAFLKDVGMQKISDINKQYLINLRRNGVLR